MAHSHILEVASGSSQGHCVASAVVPSHHSFPGLFPLSRFRIESSVGRDDEAHLVQLLFHQAGIYAVRHDTCSRNN